LNRENKTGRITGNPQNHATTFANMLGAAHHHDPFTTPPQQRRVPQAPPPLPPRNRRVLTAANGRLPSINLAAVFAAMERYQDKENRPQS
jgi:hypothetical protein